jgi:hypothetical protein
MSVRMQKPWRPVAEATQLAGHMGVFELGDRAGRVLYIGRADARSLFGLRGAVADAVRRQPTAAAFRVEVTTAYHTRHLELLMAHAADHGALPPGNADTGRIGRLSPG